MTHTATHTHDHLSLEERRAKINPAYRQDETELVNLLLEQVHISEAQEAHITQQAVQWIEQVRKDGADRTLLEDFMQRYALSTDEGVALMGLAEALLRIPDTQTADQLISDKITTASWDGKASGKKSHDHEKMITTLSGWGLVMSDYILHHRDGHFGKLVKRLGLPIIRQAVMQAVKLLGGQFVAGRTLSEALSYSESGTGKHYLFSFDMLGEGARTALKAKDYDQHYQHAIETVGKAQQDKKGQTPKTLFQKHGVSIKLSALHPRYEELQRDHIMDEMVTRVRHLALLAKRYNIPVTLDAEEADRLELSLDIFERVFRDPELAGFDGFGLAVQAYQKRAVYVIDWLIGLARDVGKIIPVRLVKGAYWDTEIKRAQERGLDGYPVFTRKINTDLSYYAAAQKMLHADDAIYPQFATHNATTMAAILTMARYYNHRHFEFQRLHGMGHPLYDVLSRQDRDYVPPCRVYAPVGQHQDLLPYLVRRLLENGANSSFVNHIYNKDIPAEKLAASPLSQARLAEPRFHPKIPLPKDMYGTRENTPLYDLSDRAHQTRIKTVLENYKTMRWTARAHYKDDIETVTERQIINPADHTHRVGVVYDAHPDSVSGVMEGLHEAWADWNDVPVTERAAIIERVADHLVTHADELIALCVYEAGKTVSDALADIREAIDFCRYYAQQARTNFKPVILPGPAGEENRLHLEGRGVCVCISPWNFPVAIYVGQIVAALVSGNTVFAKAAPQTCLTGYRIFEMMQQAGVPQNVLAFMAGDATIGQLAVAHHDTAAVVFTGSTQAAHHIQHSLAQKKNAIVPLIAETGGQNALLVDSSALPEQVVDDVIRSGFLSAGQRCSALRVLYVQEDIAPSILNMLRGAMAELRIGSPADLSTDVGPVIDEQAQKRLQAHLDAMDVPMMQAHKAVGKGYFIVPTVLGIDSMNILDQEHFGPIVHVVTFKAEDKYDLIDQINASGYGLTLGVHSRIESFIADTIKRARVGNIYINRSIIGAVVGVQPFGGMGLSGTGPKAGGPHYLLRFVQEKTVSVNMTAIGGNTVLANLDDVL
jgi:RHH-type proline utilization regulon transcriptional repressor/proline dehydrogenase/delta 1-pyrroline-5-carboxylate dehydrogenase